MSQEFEQLQVQHVELAQELSSRYRIAEHLRSPAGNTFLDFLRSREIDVVESGDAPFYFGIKSNGNGASKGMAGQAARRFFLDSQGIQFGLAAQNVRPQLYIATAGQFREVAVRKGITTTTEYSRFTDQDWAETTALKQEAIDEVVEDIVQHNRSTSGQKIKVGIIDENGSENIITKPPLPGETRPQIQGQDRGASTGQNALFDSILGPNTHIGWIIAEAKNLRTAKASREKMEDVIKHPTEEKLRDAIGRERRFFMTNTQGRRVDISTLDSEIQVKFLKAIHQTQAPSTAIIPSYERFKDLLESMGFWRETIPDIFEEGLDPEEQEFRDTQYDKVVEAASDIQIRSLGRVSSRVHKFRNLYIPAKEVARPEDYGEENIFWIDLDYFFNENNLAERELNKIGQSFIAQELREALNRAA